MISDTLSTVQDTATVPIIVTARRLTDRQRTLLRQLLRDCDEVDKSAILKAVANVKPVPVPVEGLQ